MEILYIVLGIVALFVIFVIGIYNSLVKKRIRTEEAWSDIDVQLKNRYDLVPNLVNTVKGYAKHEQETLQKVMDARSKATAMNIDASNVTKEQMTMFAGAQDSLSAGLGKLFAVAENYPDLKANENFLELQKTLEDLEDKIKSTRRFYNGAVRNYNEQIQIFPSNIIANMFKFTEREFFEIEDEKQKEVVEVNFN